MRTDRCLAAVSHSALALAAALVLALPAAAADDEVAPTVVVVDAEGTPVEVYTPPPAPPSAAERLEGADIRTHAFAEPRQPSQIPTLAWDPGAATQITTHDWRTRSGGIPSPRTGSDLVTQSWNPAGARFVPSRIRTHEWWAHAGRSY